MKDNNTKEFTIYCDMDGCLTNFVKRFQDIKDNANNLIPNDYDKANGKFSMWKLIGDEGLEWWSEMEWMSDGKSLWDYIKQFDPTICSAPSRDPLSLKGKMIWINRELNINQTNPTLSPKFKRWEEDSKIILNSQKFLFNKRFPNSILIDDTPNQINNWINNGGIGILHTSADDTIQQLEEIIKNL